MLSNKQGSMVRFGLVALTGAVVTLSYYSFSHIVHRPRHFEFHGSFTNQTAHSGKQQEDQHENVVNQTIRIDEQYGNQEDVELNGTSVNQTGTFDEKNKVHSQGADPSEQQHQGESSAHHHGGFEFDLNYDGYFTYGLALPLLLLTLASLVWNPSTNTKGTSTSPSTSSSTRFSKGEVNVWKWTMICFLLPLLYVTYDASHQRYSRGSGGDQDLMNLDWWNSWWNSFCMSLMSTSGYGACWALSAFLIPVTKHSPILDWLHVTPIQALGFHKVAGWTGLWYSMSHGYLHLRHLMGVLFRGSDIPPWYERLWILLVPSSFACIGNQNPLASVMGQDHLDDHQCWLALVNATGMISVLAYILLAITSHPRVRRYSYTLFYSVHIPSAWIMLFTAIWHYPTCALVLIPNIIYYLSFNIPVYVTQAIDHWSKKNNSPLVEANLIQDGTIELIIATNPRDRSRHGSRFLKISHPAISAVSHPFSVFSRQDLLDAGVRNDTPLTTLSILFKPVGPFTKELAKTLFPDHHYLYEENTPEAPLSLQIHGGEGDLELPSNKDKLSSFIKAKISKTQKKYSLLSTHNMIRFDSFYASSFDWVDRAMQSHDEILLVAGGVGIVPFLEFLPCLQQRIHMDSTKAGASDVDGESLMESNITMFGPNSIHLHWYCREVGLASFVWHNHLRRHVQEVWESNPACQGRLKIHLHLTSLKKGEDRLTEEILTSTPNSGLLEKITYSAVTVGQQGIIHPVKDARFTQSRWLGLLVPGSIMVIGTALHWWWYKQVVMDEEFRHDNLVMRSHSIVFTLVFAVVVSALVEFFLRNHDENQTVQVQDAIVEANNTSLEHEHGINSTSFLEVSKGRPPMDTVIRDILRSQKPGVYMCGPTALMKSVESSMGNQRRDCVFYREDSEM